MKAEIEEYRAYGKGLNNLNIFGAKNFYVKIFGIDNSLKNQDIPNKNLYNYHN